jgi:gliding motility-associated lipoprotein GldJ
MKTNKNLIINVFLVLVLLVGTASCSKKSSSKSGSSATGWKVNDKKGGFQYNSKYKKQDAAPGLVMVEGGTFTMGKVQDDVMRDWNNTANQQHVASFYMDETEVTNLMYLEYLDWTKRVFPADDAKYEKIYLGILPDTLVWRNRLGYNETYTNNYLRHPAYASYPVVGVNWIQAVEFSKWRTERVNENALEKAGYLEKDAKILKVTAEKTFNTETYLNAPRKVAGTKGQPATTKNPTGVYAQRTSGILLPEYRLPTEAEWEYAAAADVGQRFYNTFKGQKKYPWSGSYTRSGKRQTRGDQLANFKQSKGDYGGIAGWSDDGADITNIVKSYPPNDFGLYDMAGNVAEWVADVYRPMVDDEVSDFNYFRGNEYEKNKLVNGKVDVITDVNNIKYETLSNGKVIARSLPGQIVQVPVDANETYLRQNFDKSYEKNYRDGDKQSTNDFGNANASNSNDSKGMYNSPIHNVKFDNLGVLVSKQKDSTNTRTTLINDNVRVYKGGSWRDRAYWLDPAQRRYFPQDMATDYIGFRCAMSKVGPKADKKKRARN